MIVEAIATEEVEFFWVNFIFLSKSLRLGELARSRGGDFDGYLMS